MSQQQKDRGGTIEPGVVLVDKPCGPTSFGIVQHVRRALRIKKVGHAGTLDPFASGLLIICAGRPATRHISLLMAGEKEYEATLKLGIETDTQDREGQVIAQRPVGELDEERVRHCIAGFVGEQLQTPPQYSALKHQGKPLYYYARKGIEVPREPRPITIKDIQTLAIDKEHISIRVTCGKGTYIRTLAADIGGRLGCGAHLVALRRLRSGPFSVREAVKGDLLQDKEQASRLLERHMLRVDEACNRLALKGR